MCLEQCFPSASKKTQDLMSSIRPLHISCSHPLDKQDHAEAVKLHKVFPEISNVSFSLKFDQVP